jgi:hypothetical protein
VIEDFNLSGLHLIARLGNPSNSVVKRCPKKDEMAMAIDYGLLKRATSQRVEIL